MEFIHNSNENIKVNFVFDINDMRKTSNTFQNKFNALKNIQMGQKLCVNDEILSLDTSEINRWQGIRRYFQGQGREVILIYIEDHFVDYTKFLDMIISSLSCEHINDNHKALALNNQKFIDNIIPGLDIVKKTYPEHVRINNKIESIIFTFLDYKKQMDSLINDGLVTITLHDPRERSGSFS